MGMKAGNPDSVTIVGGRPMHRAVETKDLPQGVEQVLTLAGLDPAFRAAVSLDPVAAAAGKGIALDPVEASLLRSLPPNRISEMAERIIIPNRPGRRSFIKAVSASVVAMVTGNAFLLCSGCTGADTFEGDTQPQQQWMTLAGYTCYVCTPSQSAESGPLPVLIALHGEDETCLSSAQRWQAVGEQFGFCLVAINWTQDARLPDERVELVSKLGAILTDLADEVSIDKSALYMTSRGIAADMLLAAALLGKSNLSFRSVSMLGGVPTGDWTTDADSLLSTLVSSPPSLYGVLGAQDADFDQAKAFLQALASRGVKTQSEELPGATDQAVLSFSTIWSWMAGPSDGGPR